MRLLAVTGLYVAGIVGAGFASGQELVVFFVSYGKAGLAGVLWSAVLLCLGTGLVLESCAKHRVTSYRGLFDSLGPAWGLVLDAIYALFLLVGISVMFSGLAAAGRSPVGSILLRFGAGALVFALLRDGTEDILKVSGWLAPVLVGMLCAFSLIQVQNWNWSLHGLTPGSLLRALEAGTLYGCYNLGFALAFLASSHHYLHTKRERWSLALLGGAALGISMVLLYLALANLPSSQLETPFPLAHLVRGWGILGPRVYQLLLWSAMFSTAAANSLALISRLAEQPKLSWQRASFLVLGLGLSLSHFGFAWLIKMAYPILGLAGLWLLALLLRDALR